jgi:death-on-curing protein
MRFLTVEEVLLLHNQIIEKTGGGRGILDLGLLESALSQCRMSFEGREVYPSLTDKAAAMCFSIVKNHPFVDGHKRTGHAAMEVFLVLNGYELCAEIDEAETTMVRLASGEMDRDRFTRWVRDHVNPLS